MVCKTIDTVDKLTVKIKTKTDRLTREHPKFVSPVLKLAVERVVAHSVGRDSGHQHHNDCGDRDVPQNSPAI